MGTRCLTVMKNGDGDETAVLYRQYDGYPTGHGDELVSFLQSRTLTNGLSFPKPEGIGMRANGAACLFAQLVTHFKEQEMEAGFYLHPPGTRDCGEEYIYTVKVPKMLKNVGPLNDCYEGLSINLECKDVYSGRDLFNGSIETWQGGHYYADN